ncbi:MAG: CotH kinase family protein [Massiliimalia sp.]
MSTHRYINRICCGVLAVILILTIVLMNGEKLGIEPLSSSTAYESRLFDTTKVHTIEIVMDDWDSFLETCENEEYSDCSVVIDGESYHNVGIRAKGNTSLSTVSAYGNDRYSFKIEFDHYDSTKSYYGLDKISLNNIIQDNTYMKDYLSYQMMGYFGVASPLCSYVYITVNGDDWGLYLAVEGVEESFLERNYGSDYGNLYKPDSMSMGGGGPGNGMHFQKEQLEEPTDGADSEDPSASNTLPQRPERNFDLEESTDTGGQLQPPSMDTNKDNPGGRSMGSDDVSLIYTDDNYDSYSNIFDNAKTEITDQDKDQLIQSLKQLNESSNLDQVVDMEQVIRYFVVHNFVCNFDSYTGSMIHNYYLYEEDGKLSMIPWDYNLAFGGFQSNSGATELINYPIDTPVSGGTIDSRPMLAWIFSSEAYTQLYHQYFGQFISEYFDSGYFANMMDTTYQLIAPYVEKDPTKFCTYEEFQTGFDTLKEFCLLRAESVTGQLDGTIPSTSEEQAADASSLINGDALSISDMGSMNGGMNKNGRFEGMGNTDPQTAFGENSSESSADPSGEIPENGEPTPGDSSQTAQPPDSMTPSEQSDNFSDNVFPPFGEQETIDGQGEEPSQQPNMEKPDFQQATTASDSSDHLSLWILLGSSGLILILGILFAYRFRQ